MIIIAIMVNNFNNIMEINSSLFQLIKNANKIFKMNSLHSGYYALINGVFKQIYKHD